jgi:hypothetical protein
MSALAVLTKRQIRVLDAVARAQKDGHMAASIVDVLTEMPSEPIVDMLADLLELERRKCVEMFRGKRYWRMWLTQLGWSTLDEMGL